LASIQEQVRRWKEREAAVETEEIQNRNQRTENADDDKAGKLPITVY